MANHWPTIGQPLANHWPTISQPVAARLRILLDLLSAPTTNPPCWHAGLCIGANNKSSMTILYWRQQQIQQDAMACGNGLANGWSMVGHWLVNDWPLIDNWLMDGWMDGLMDGCIDGWLCLCRASQRRAGGEMRRLAATNHCHCQPTSYQCHWSIMSPQSANNQSIVNHESVINQSSINPESIFNQSIINH